MSLLKDFLLGKEEKTTGNLSVVFEVKRPVNPGEYIKVINAAYVPLLDDDSFAYKNGDIILSIDKSNQGFNQCRFKEGRDKAYREYVLDEAEYVVLEGYIPTGVENHYD